MRENINYMIEKTKIVIDVNRIKLQYHSKL